MILKALILTLALGAVSGRMPDISEDLVANVVWDYLSQESTHAKDQEQQTTELTQQLRNLFQNNIVARIYNRPYTYDVKDLVPFAINLYQRLTKDSEKQKEEIQKELEDLRARMLPHAQEVSQKIAQNVSEMHEAIFEYPQLIYHNVGRMKWMMESHIEKVKERLEKAQSSNVEDLKALWTSSFNELQQLIRKDMSDGQAWLMAYEVDLKEIIDKRVQELGHILALFAQDVQEKLSHQLGGLSFQMRKVAGLLLANVSAGMEELSHHLRNLTEDAREKQGSTSEEMQKALSELGQQMNQQIEEFQLTLTHYNETYQKEMKKLLKDFEEKLGPNAGSSDDHLIFLEKELKDSVKTFFNTILKNFHEKRLALENQARNQTLEEQAQNPAPSAKSPTP